MILWKNNEFQKIDEITELLGIVFDELMKFVI
jgi:hypothetical protein